MAHIPHTYAVIMAGGIGSRFWPMSRSAQPKQFLDILGTGRSLIRMTYDRLEKLVPADHILVVTNARYKDLVAAHLPDLPLTTSCASLSCATPPRASPMPMQ
jgi:mannose-1-phosphate guanylyltransferase